MSFLKELKENLKEDANELLKNYEDTLKGHDWRYEYSDDHRYWTAGNQNMNKILSLLSQLNKEGLIDAAFEIWEKMAPKDIKWPGPARKENIE
jgi:hypothetical protein